MIEAFVMVKTDAGETDAVLEPIRELGNVTEAHLVAGEYDVVVEVKAAEMPSIVQVVSGSIREFDGVTDSKTYLSLAD